MAYPYRSAPHGIRAGQLAVSIFPLTTTEISSAGIEPACVRARINGVWLGSRIKYALPVWMLCVNPMNPYCNRRGGIYSYAIRVSPPLVIPPSLLLVLIIPLLLLIAFS